MAEPSDNSASNLQGAGRLTIDAVVGVVDIIESMHRTITTLGGVFAGSSPHRTTGLTGLLYSSVRTLTRLIGEGLDTALAVLSEAIGDTGGSPTSQTVRSALNGVLGDYLVATDNPLAIPMQLRRGAERVAPDDPGLGDEVRRAGGRVLLLAHGSCANDLHWRRNGHNHGAALADEFGYLPVYLLYNSGRHISENGAELAELLEEFVAALDEPIDLTILGHSMGGLLARSACHYAEEAGHRWRQQLGRLVFVGTPHHGAPLERYGNWIDNILQISPYTRPFSRLGKIRSAGVTDLRWGNLLRRDWEGLDRFEMAGDRRHPVPLPDDVDCYAVAATTDKPGEPPDRLASDGLVPVDSALGDHDDPALDLAIPPSHRRIVYETAHLDLLGSPDAYDALREWLA